MNNEQIKEKARLKIHSFLEDMGRDDDIDDVIDEIVDEIIETANKV